MKRRNFLQTVTVLSSVGTLAACGSTGVELQGASGGSADVPLHLEGLHGHVAVVIDGQTFRLGVDSGADDTVLSVQAASRLNKSHSATCVTLHGPGGPAACARVVRFDRFSIGNAWFNNWLAYVVEWPPESPLDGVLGASFFRRFVVRLNYDAQRFEAWLPADAPKADPAAHRLDMEVEPIFLVQAKIGGVEGMYIVDSGAGNVATIFRPTVESLGLRQRFAPAVRMVTGMSLNGLTTVDVARVDKLEIGDFVLSRPVVELWTEQTGPWGNGAKWTGNLGAGLLTRFVVTIDAPGRALYLLPGSRYKDSFRAPTSGLAARWIGDRLEVLDVAAGSPASEAGIQAGERLLAIAGIAVRPEQGRKILEPLRAGPGTKVELQVGESDERSRPVTLELRELV